MKSPLSLVKEKFGDKAKLVTAVETFQGDDLWVARVNKGKGLAHVSNAKLLALHATFTAVKERFGTRAKLIDAICELEKRTKDEGFKKRLGAYPVPRLWDMFRAADKRHAPRKKKTAAREAAKAKPAAVKPAVVARPKQSGRPGKSQPPPKGR